MSSTARIQLRNLIWVSVILVASQAVGSCGAVRAAFTSRVDRVHMIAPVELRDMVEL
jgi:hypothetical protein